MRVLVVGGAGYIGSHCVKMLEEHGHEVVVYDNLKLGNRGAVPDTVPLEWGDVLDRRRLAETFQRYAFDGVMHFAALLNVNESLAQPRLYYENNVLGTLNLVGEMLNHQVRKLVFSSSCAIYGVPPSVPIEEDMPARPITPYGRTKWIVEQALEDLTGTRELGSVSLRYFNAAGAAPDGSIGEARADEYHLIPLILQVALGQRERIHIYGTDYPTRDGTAVRDYVHVDDLSRAHVLALEYIETGRADAFNVGTGVGTTVQEVIDAARRVTASPIPAEEGERRAGDPPELYAQAERIRRELGWQPQYTEIEQTVASAWHWHRHHPQGYKT